MFQSQTINTISINVHLRTSRITLCVNKNRLLGNLQKILNSHFLTPSSLFFKSWEIVIRVIILTLNLHEHVTVITVRYSVRGYDFKSYLPYFESIFSLPIPKIKLIESLNSTQPKNLTNFNMQVKLGNVTNVTH